MADKHYTLSQEEIQLLCQNAVEQGIKSFNDMRKREEKKKRKQTDKVELTKKKLKEYRAVKLKVSEREFTDAEIPELRFNALEDLMGQITSSDDRTERKIESRLNKQVADTLEIKNIDRAYEEYKEGCEKWGSEEDQRRCRVIYLMYMDNDVYSVSEIAERENIAERTVFRDCSIGAAKLSAYLYGF